MWKCNRARNRTWDLPIVWGKLYHLSYLDTIAWQARSRNVRVGLSFHFAYSKLEIWVIEILQTIENSTELINNKIRKCSTERINNNQFRKYSKEAINNSVEFSMVWRISSSHLSSLLYADWDERWTRIMRECVCDVIVPR